MYLVIETSCKNHEFTHFIKISKDCIETDIKHFVAHVKCFDESVDKVYFSEAALSNW